MSAQLQPIDMAWDGEGEKGALSLGQDHGGPRQSMAAANTKMGHGHSKPQKGSGRPAWVWQGSAKAQPPSPDYSPHLWPLTGLICLKS